MLRSCSRSGLVGLFLLLVAPAAFGVSSFEIEFGKERSHVTADRTLYHSKEKIYEAFGHVVISSEGKRLSADYAWIDTNTRELKAKGNVVFVDRTTTITAAELQFNLETGYGAIFYGKVSNDVYTLKGQLIRRISEDRFLTTEGEYTTCRDCPESWKLAARNVDLTVDGYAFMDNVYVKIKDIPTLFIPYLILPVKTRRQTGLLFPRLSTSSRHGFSAVQPLFIAIDDHQDATLGIGKYSSRGLRYEGEYRYKSYGGIEGQIDFFRTNDRSFIGQGAKFRQAIKARNEWPFHDNFQMRWRIFEVSDRKYPEDFPEDIHGDLLPALESNVVAMAPFSDFFVSAELKRYRNLLYDQIIGFDGGMVQALPTVYFGVKERRIAGPFFASFLGRYDNFTRHNGPFQDNNRNLLYDPATENLREANRFLLAPEISAPFRLGPYLSIGPSIQYNEARYSFDLPTANRAVDSTAKRYVLGRVETSTTFEKVYPYDGEMVSRLKHQVTPFITYNNIPWISEDKTHPFQAQLAREGGLFDQFDIIPITNSTNFLRLPLGNSLYYGLTSRVIRKMRSPDEMPKVYPYDLPAPPKKYPAPQNRKQELSLEREKLWDQFNPRYSDYQEIWNLSVTQAYDLKEAKRQSDKKRAFSLLLAKSNLSVDDFSNTIEYRFYPRIVRAATVAGADPEIFSNKHSFSTTTTWYLKNLKNFRGTRSFVRSLSFSFTNSSQPTPSRTLGGEINWALNDFFSVHYAHSVDLLTKERIARSVRTTYSSPSECWQLGLRYQQTQSSGSEFGIDLGLNLTGYGYVGVNELRNQQSGGGIFGGG